MTNTPSEPDVNEAETQAVVQRVRRISVISSVIMLAGVGTVLAVIGYRLMSTPGPGSSMTGTISPEGRVTSAIAADGRLTVTYERDGSPLIVVYDLRTLKETHRVSVGGPQVPRP
jgi:hypothetical protein